MNHMKSKHVRDLLRQPMTRRFRLNPIVLTYVKDITTACCIVAAFVVVFLATR